MLQATHAKKAAVFVERFLWRPTELIAGAIDRAAKANLRDIQMLVSNDSSAPSSGDTAGLSTVLRTLISGTQFLLHNSEDTDYAARIRPIEFTSRTGIYTWTHAFALIAMRHRIGYEWLFLSHVSPEHVPEALLMQVAPIMLQVCGERSVANPTRALDAEARHMSDVIAGSIEFAIRRMHPTIH